MRTGAAPRRASGRSCGGRRFRALAGGLALSLATAPPLVAQEWRDFRAARPAAALESLDVEVYLGAGRLGISPSESSFLYDARVRYDAERFRPVRAWSGEGGRGYLKLAVASRPGDATPASVRLEDRDIELDLEELRRLGDERSRLDLGLGSGLPVDLRVAVGAAEARLDLGDLALRSLEYLTGASETRMSFDAPNRIDMERMSLRAGASEFSAEGLGNARFRELEFSGAIGDVALDFSGAWARDAVARIKMGAGGLRIRVPAGIGVRLTRSSLLMAVDAEGLEKNDRVYTSPNWADADFRLDIVLEAAFGSVQVERTADDAG